MRGVTSWDPIIESMSGTINTTTVNTTATTIMIDVTLSNILCRISPTVAHAGTEHKPFSRRQESFVVGVVVPMLPRPGVTGRSIRRLLGTTPRSTAPPDLPSLFRCSAADC